MVGSPARKQVVLVGCGNIGFRHLQALTAMTEPCDIAVIEPAPQAHPRIEALIAQLHADGPHSLRLCGSVAGWGVALGQRDATAAPVDLAVIATDARHRMDAWTALRAHAPVNAVIFEKILFQSVAEIDLVDRQLAADGAEGFVNCGRRGFPDYQSLATRFGGAQNPVDLTIDGALFGLASNAVHFLDLAELLNKAPLTGVDLGGLSPGSVASKRPGYVEIFGTLRATLGNGAQVSVTCHDTGQMAVGVHLTAKDGSDITIDEVAATLTEHGQTQPFSLRFVSGMPELYESILRGQGSALTPYRDSARQHRLFLTALATHLGLSVHPETRLPVS